MDRIYIRDRNGKNTGSFERHESRVIGRDAHGIIRGWFEPCSNRTLDASGRLVAYGDVLSALISRKA